MKELFFVLITFSSIVALALDHNEVILSPIPTLVSGTFAPFNLIIDGQMVADTKYAAKQVEVNGQTLEVGTKNEKTFSYSTKSDAIDLVATFSGKHKPYSKQLTLPNARIAKTREHDAEIKLFGVKTAEIDGQDVSIVQNKIHWPFPIQQKRIVHVLSIVSSDGRTRDYNLTLSSEISDVSTEDFQIITQDDWSATLIRPQESNQIKSLNLKLEQIRVRNEKGILNKSVKLTGQLTGPGELFIENEKLPATDEGKFSVEISINEQFTEKYIYLKSRNGNLVKEAFLIRFQEGKNPTDTRWLRPDFGFLLGPGWSSYFLTTDSASAGLSATTTRKLGFAVGGSATNHLYKKWEAEADLLYLRRKYQIDSTVASVTTTFTDTVNSIMLALLANYPATQNLRLGLGPYVSYGIGSIFREYASGPNAAINFNDADIQHLDFGAVASVEYLISLKFASVVTNIRYDFSLANSSSSDDLFIRYNDILFFVGLRWSRQ